jgi:hypothetical protein
MSDKIIRFPGPGRPPAGEPQPPVAAEQLAVAADQRGPDGLTDDQRKAIQLILGGMTFVCVGIKPTERGADFYTAVHGDATDLRNALDHLPGVIQRACSRKGIV